MKDFCHKMLANLNTYNCIQYRLKETAKYKYVPHTAIILIQFTIISYLNLFHILVKYLKQGN